MKATKLKSGNWRARAFYIDENGKQHRKSFTAPTRKEAEFLANTYTYVSSKASRGAQTFREAIRSFNDLRGDVFSPTTLMNYKRMEHYFPAELLDKRMDQITKEDIDAWISKQSERLAPKTVKNRYAFLHEVFEYFEIDIADHATPQAIAVTYKVPTDAHVKTLIRYAKEIQDEELLLAIMFGAFGCMRRGEMCAITPDDLDGNILHVHKNKVNAEHGTIVKAPKTTESDRYIEVPAPLLKVMQSHSRYITLQPNTIYNRFKRAVKVCGLPDYRLHDLRHYCASVMHANGVPNVYIMKFGGWKNEKVLNAIYRNAMQDYEKKYSKRMSRLFDKISK